MLYTVEKEPIDIFSLAMYLAGIIISLMMML